MSQRNLRKLRQRAVANGPTIQLDVDVHADIDHDFFDTQTKTFPGQKKLPNERNSLAFIESKRTSKFTQETKCQNETDFKVQNTTINVCELNAGTKKNLMNCIAFSVPSGSSEHILNDVSYSESNIDSVSSDTTSEITDVTSRATSSEYSLLKADKCIRKGSPPKQKSTLTKSKRPSSMKSLHQRLEHLDIGDHCDTRSNSSMSYKSGDIVRGNMIYRRNMSFSNNELRVIDRDNAILLKKIEGNRGSRPKQVIVPANFSLSSSAINRRNIQIKIDAENKRIVRKLETVKSSTDTSSPWVFSRR